ncbi:hypothetical protein OHB01_12615 [Microbispora hainanensis]|uniref:hypothetical protein n=1 Tax=Microbispora hainanensis TaxID=568844 RepID=UPI002E2C42A9|nr:hypothetical protein [Microbispora hainanensis]
MTLTFPDPALAQVVSSYHLLSQTWPVAIGEVMLLLHVLRMATPCLSSALATGLVSVIAPGKVEASSRIVLAHKTVILDAVAMGENDAEVLSPHLFPASVSKLEVAELVVAGRSELQRAAG